MARNNRELFESLNLLSEPEEVNPLPDLGISLEFAAKLLQEDPTGDALRAITGGLSKVLARRYHPDHSTGSRDRFEAIDKANQRIDQASVAKLKQWTTTAPKQASSMQLGRLKATHDEQFDRSVGLFQASINSTHHSNHYSQLELAQGLILERDNRLLLMRQDDEGNLQTVRGSDANYVHTTATSRAFDFSVFLKQHGTFGLEVNTPINAYIDEYGRASILDVDLSFLMDVTAPLGKYRMKRADAKSLQLFSAAQASATTLGPILFAMDVPGSSSSHKPKYNLTQFEGTTQRANTQSVTSNLEIIGSTAESSFYNSVKHSRKVGAAALSGNSVVNSGLNYFNLLTIPASKFIEYDSGYTPLISAGNSLLLFDQVSQSPIVTDAKIVGIIGSNAKAY